jgi:hypothetical protein
MFRIWPVFCASVVSILLVNHANQPPGIINSGQPGFSICHLPCWAGVTPYETAFSEALKIITANLPGWSLNIQANNAQVSFSGQHSESRIDGIIDENRGLVGRMRLDVALPLGYFIEELGKPYCVRANHLTSIDVDVVVIYWHLGDKSVMGITTLNSSEKWYPGVIMEALVMLVSDEQCSLGDALPWMGFARLWRYQTDYWD